MSIISDQMRHDFNEADNRRDAGLEPPTGITRFDDIIYGHADEHWQRLDVYRPEGVSGKLPVIISVHGGGWVYGDKERYSFYCLSLAKRGFAVVNFSYRLAPEYKYPSSFEDTSMVCSWVRDNAEEYGFDMNHVFAVGDSAGAHMLSLFAAALTNPDFASKVGYPLPDNFHFTGIALNCGVYRIRLSDDPNDNTTLLMKDLLVNGGTQEEISLMSCMDYITESFPPSYIMTCPGDFLNGQPKFLISALEEKNVPFVYCRYTNMENQLGHVFHLNMRFKEAEICNDDECNFFKRFI